jgi:hypothetical protein
VKVDRASAAVEPAATEREIHRAIFAHFRIRGAPQTILFHPRNEGRDQRGRARAINAGMGVLPGLPDLVGVREGRTYALELKSASGKLSPAQQQTLDRMQQAGAVVGVAYGLDEALAWLEQRGILRGSST